MADSIESRSRGVLEGIPGIGRVHTILSPGLHAIREDDLFDLFVKPFSSRERRIELLGNLRLLIEHVRSTGVRCELWIDGSFSSPKEWPNDIDVVMFFERADIDQITDKQFELLQQLKNRAYMKVRYSADIYFDPADDPARKAHWQSRFGVDKMTGNPKGIAILRIGYEQD